MFSFLDWVVLLCYRGKPSKEATLIMHAYVREEEKLAIRVSMLF